MKRKSKPKRQATRKAPHRASRKTPRPRKPAAPVKVPPVETANLPVVRTQDVVPTTDPKVKALVSQNFYELATGLKEVPLPMLALMDKLTPQQILRWVPFCRTPARFRWWRPGPGAKTEVCGRGVTCRTCPSENFDACRVRLEYVPGAFMLLCANTLFPGRWSMKDMKVEREGDLFIASGYLVIKHHDGTVQEIYQTGQCTIRANLGHARKGAITDFVKKALSELGIAGDVYSGIGTQHDVPPETEPKQPVPADARRTWQALFDMVDKRLREEPRSVHKSGYTPRLKWEDAANLWPEFGEATPPFETADAALETFAELPVESRRALYAKIRLKWLRSDKALMDPKYGQEAPDDYRPEDAQPKPPAKPAKREAQMPADVLANFWTKVRRILGGCTQGQAEIAVNTVTRLRADRGQTKAADWLDLDAIEGQETMAVLGEEIAKGTFAHITGVRAGT